MSILASTKPIELTREEMDRARKHAVDTVKRSGTSFASGMRILSKPRREGMYAVYAFCREVDDIADDEGIDVAERQRGLDEWRDEIERLFNGSPQTLTGQALLEPIARFNLPKQEFILVIEGMEMDAHGPIVAPTMEQLLAYTRRAAGAVGQLSMPIFGAPQNAIADKFSLSLGDALQLTNILRDIGEDADLGRLYLPSELLDKYHVPKTPDQIINAAGLPRVAEDLATIAGQKFDDAREALQSLDWRVLRPALLMMGVYEGYYKKLITRGWDKTGEPLSMSKIEKLAISARYALAPPIKVSE